MLDQRIYSLKGKVQNYAWGGTRFLSELLGMENAEQKPFAEYWMGAHGQVAAELLQPDGGTIALNDFIAQDPAQVLGRKVAGAFGKLPFLFKVLDVKDMLSIQVHPTVEEAKKGFAREEAAGIKLSDPARNFKDENHKPEIMVALSDFWLLHGFKKDAEIAEILQEFPTMRPYLPHLKLGNVAQLYAFLMRMSQQALDTTFAPIAEKIIPLYKEGKLHRMDPSFWAARAMVQYNGPEPVHYDRGLFSIYFFNLLQLHPGEAIFQGAGIPHAYLEGQNMELMANSDNVLRGGLTPKYIDVEALLQHISYEAVEPDVWPEQERYPTIVPDFSIAKIIGAGGRERVHKTESAAILFLLKGAVTVTSGATTLNVKKGGAVFIIADTTYKVEAIGEEVIYFIASAGIESAE